MHKYKFYPAEGAILAEIYLPKRAHFQGALYSALTEGFRIENIKKHFRDSTNREKITDILQYFYPALANYTPEAIDDFPDVFHGYSMYEVDGVFANKSSESTPIYEERTQVIRIIFKPDLKTIFKTVYGEDTPQAYMDAQSNQLYRQRRNLIGVFLRNSHHAIDDAPSPNGEKLNDTELQLWREIKTWLEYCGLFLFGFVVFKICDLELPAPAKMEDEIWVTSVWNIAINRMVHQPV